MSQTITLTLTNIAHGGEAIGHHQGKIIFVPYAIPGETVAVELVEEKQRWARARLLRVLQASPERVAPPCPYFGPGQCGGCQWQHIDYERQLQLKAEVVADQLRRLGRIADPPVLDPIALADESGLLAFRYRNHVQFMVDEQGRLGLARAAASPVDQEPAARGQAPEDIIPVDECLLLHPLLDEVHAALLAGALAEQSEPQAGPGAELVDAEEESGQPPASIRRISLRAGVNTGQRLLAFETADDRAPGFLLEGLPLACVVRRRDHSVQALIGEPWVEELIAGRAFRISANSFFRANTVGAEAMVEMAAELLAPLGHETLLDAYCGGGLFGLSLAGQVGQVIGVEESEAACEDFAWNARDLDNVALHEGPVADVLATFDLELAIDAAIIDPPRSGAGPEVARQLRRLRVPKVLYASCDPATLARDARLLIEAGYRLEQVQPVDLFPQTYHVESLALYRLAAAA